MISASDFIPFILMIHVSGGWDTTMVFDNKIGSGYVAQESGAKAANGAGNIAYVDHSTRPSVKAFFDTYGANAAIVNGIHAGGVDRQSALRTMMGAVPPSRYRYTDWLSFYTYSTNPVMNLPHVVINAPWLPGDYASVAVNLASDSIADFTAAVPADQALGAAGETALAAFRKSAYGTFYTAANDKSLDADKLKALFFSYAREGVLYADVPKALKTIGDTTADTSFVRNGKLAVELFAQGSSQAVTLQSGPDNEWDTTTDHYARQSALYEELFAGINNIMAYATTRGIAGKMILIVTSERGRAPLLNAEGGKEAWPFTSVLLWGVAIRGGTVAGLTDATLRGMPVDPIFGGQTTTGGPLEMANIMSGIYLKTNVPTKILLPDHKPLSPVLQADDL